MADGNSWHYTNGTWNARAFPAKRGDDDSWKAVAQTVGYVARTAIGDGYSGQLSLFSREDSHAADGLPDYLVIYSDGFKAHLMTADTFPEALDVMARYAPVISAMLATKTSSVTALCPLERTNP
jgi:hypothetical protein